MGAVIELEDIEWKRVEDVFDPVGRRGAPARYPRRHMVEAMLFIARTGCQWRYLPDRFPPWQAVWKQWSRWRANSVWARAMARLARLVRQVHRRPAEPSMVMIDAQTVRGGRGGPTFHEAGGKGGHTRGTKRSILIEILGLPLAVRVDSAKPHDVRSGRLLLNDHLGELQRVQAIVADRGYTALDKLAARRHLALDIKVPPKSPPLPVLPGQKPKKPERVFTPLAPLYKVENAFARLGTWRRLSRCYEGSPESARAWLEVACVGYLFGRLRVEPT
jgi:transposase